MPIPSEFVLIVDPWCGWCYGAQPGLQRLREEDPQARWTLLPSGLFCQPSFPDAERRAYFWRNDRQIATRTGQPFSDAYREHILGDDQQGFDSSLATLTWHLLSEVQPEAALDILHAVQQLRYVAGDVSLAAHATLAGRFGCDPQWLAAQLAAGWPPALHAQVQQARQLMQEHQLFGVPALLGRLNGQLQALPGQMLI
ncbi:DsbA family protein [Chitinilyticum piscinae]|uniref:DsbA family protein n=1 Tax=Chitinilyticum piscinae TaxID=2866724 RepID=A0A8J7FJZ8_9NEIS|nr:DsbA family protein [Chitinilyticum piscinae]MBE9610810.1 DsbA family protein [Chitinilyticum piscinae]